MVNKRWQPLHPDDESLLVDLTARDDEVGDAALNAITHLPLRSEAWAVVRNRLEHRLQASGPERQELVRRVLRWMPDEDWGSGEGDLYVMSGRPVRPEPGANAYSPADLRWMNSTALGCVLVDDATRQVAIEAVLPGLDHRRDELARYGIEAIERSVRLDPVTVTAWFLFAYQDGRYDVGLGNDIVATVARDSSFTPDVLGLLAVYRRALAAWAARVQAPIGEWIIDDRDDEQGDCWLSWQVAWTASRGGIADVVAGLRKPLSSGTTEDVIATLSFLADVADYAVQPEPEGFGGGRLPPRLAPDSRHRVFYDQPPAAKGPPAVESAATTGSPRVDEDVQFTVYKPASIRPDVWYSMLAFAHKTELIEGPDGALVDPTKVVEKRATGVLGDRIDDYAKLGSDATGPLPRGDEIRFVPEVAGIEFNPPVATVRWEEPVHMSEFRLKADPATKARSLRGAMLIYLGPLVIGQVSLSFAIASDESSTSDRQVTQRGQRYRRIFPSYSHRDAEIVEEIRRAVETLGDRYSQDVVTLRSGEQWEPKLQELIEDANIFQLFWSNNSMRSDFVRREWTHALSLNRPGFIRPLYWELPRPESPSEGLPPPDLNQLHFSVLPGVAGQLTKTQCPNCATPNPDGRHFCLRCGSHLDPAAVPGDTGQPAGVALPPPMPAQAPPAQMQQQQQRERLDSRTGKRRARSATNGKGCWWTAALAIAAIVVLVAAFLFS